MVQLHTGCYTGLVWTVDVRSSLPFFAEKRKRITDVSVLRWKLRGIPSHSKYPKMWVIFSGGLDLSTFSCVYHGKTEKGHYCGGL